MDCRFREVSVVMLVAGRLLGVPDLLMTAVWSILAEKSEGGDESGEIPDELLEDRDRYRGLPCDVGLTKERKIGLLQRMSCAGFTAHVLPDSAGRTKALMASQK